MGKKVGAAAACVVLLASVILVYPVGGAVWSAQQVDRLAVVDGELRSETVGQAAINEALSGVRVDRFRRVLSVVTNRRCHPLHLEFHTKTGWVSATVQCPGGFFLDFVPRPGMFRPSHP